MLGKTEIETIFRKHYKDLLAFAYTYTNNIHDSEEIVQEVFLSVWEQRKKINIDRSLKNYLMGAVKFKAINFQKRHIKYSFENENHELDIIEELKINDNNLNRKLRENIKKLPDQCRTIFLLSRFTNLTYAEIASHLNISKKTVETQISIALKKLKQSLVEFYKIEIILCLFTLIKFFFNINQ